MILDDIISQKRKDLDEMKRRLPLHRLRETVEKKTTPHTRDFKKAINHARELNLICELKKASPSAGLIREDFQPLRIASLLEYGGAAAISVLTESHYFKGRPSYLKTVRQVTTIPLLRKDFILETYQVYESALLEADAYLLIATLLTLDELRELIRTGTALGMTALVEIHHLDDLHKAVDAGASVIGINNRDLKTSHVDPDRAKTIIPHVPKGIPIVVESGFSKYEELMSYKSLGVRSFLVGTALMKSADILDAMNRLSGNDLKWKTKKDTQ